MPTAPVIAALALPAGCLVGKRIPKTHLIEHGTPATGDKKQINEGLEELTWHAALKPTTTGVAAFTDATREYLEIAVLVAVLRPVAKRARLVELIHRAIPYPVLLVTAQGECATVSLAHKRRSQAEAGKFVLEGPVVATEPMITARPEPADVAFLAGLALTAQPGAHLHALYHGWLARVTAHRAAALTGRVEALAEPAATHEARVAYLDEHARLTAELAGLHASAARARQVSRRVELNLAIRDCQAELDRLEGLL